jgi:hypothetical protein
MSDSKESKHGGGEKSAVKNYMGGGFDKINKTLRGQMKSVLGAELALQMERELPNYERVAAKTVLYRWVGGREILKDNNPEYGANRPDAFRTGGECRDKGFMSCSLRESYITDSVKAIGTRQHVLQITTCENSRARNVSALRQNANEAEVIFPPMVKFIITSKGNKSFGKKTCRVWYLTELAEALNTATSSTPVSIASLD